MLKVERPHKVLQKRETTIWPCLESVGQGGQVPVRVGLLKGSCCCAQVMRKTMHHRPRSAIVAAVLRSWGRQCTTRPGLQQLLLYSGHEEDIAPHVQVCNSCCCTQVMRKTLHHTSRSATVAAVLRSWGRHCTTRPGLQQLLLYSGHEEDIAPHVQVCNSCCCTQVMKKTRHHTPRSANDSNEDVRMGLQQTVYYRSQLLKTQLYHHGGRLQC